MLSADDDDDEVGSAVRCANKVAGAKAEAEASTRANAASENLMAKQSTECANVTEKRNVASEHKSRVRVVIYVEEERMDACETCRDIQWMDDHL